MQYSDSLNYSIECPDGTNIYPNGRTEFKNDGWIWKWSKKKVAWALNNGFIEFRKSKSKKGGWAVCYKNYMNVDNEGKVIERSAPKKNVIWDVLNANSASEMKDIFDINIFKYSKPVDLIKKIIKYSTFDHNDYVLDFFAGSGTTAHAVMDLNKEDGGNRKFILVQIPEATDEKSEAYKAGYKTISDICIERVKRAGEKLTESSKQQKLIDEGKDLDVGFKVFKLASSHFPENTFAPDSDKTDEENKKALEAYIKKATSQKGLFKDGVVDLVYEIALKDGFELTLKMEKVKDFDKNTVYRVTDSHREAFICVDDSLEDATIKQLEDHKDQRFICLHTSVNTTKKWNLQNVLGSNLWLV